MGRGRRSARLLGIAARVTIERLENRTLLCGVGLHDANPLLVGSLPYQAGLPPVPSVGPQTFVSASVPALSSNPSASAKLYLDFDGHPAAPWGTYSVSTTPAYDIDGNPASFSTAELNNITEIWERVAEKFSPFNLDVTTVNPGNTNNLQTLVAVIGGNGSWLGATAGGVAYVGGFSNTAPNQVWIFPANLSNGFPKYIAEATAHEAGHGFNLQHQSTWSGTTKTNEYNPGDSNKAPIMGTSYSSNRGLWWNGTSSISSTSIQDDLAVISGATNAVGYRADDRGNTTGTAAALTVSAGVNVSGSGIIERTNDIDYFYFDQTVAGSVNLAVNGPRGPMLDLRIELRNSAGTLIGSADTSALGESIIDTLTPGRYYLGVFSKANFGDVGQYTITGTINGPTDGGLDSTFGTGGKVTSNFGTSEIANAVAIQSDGKILVGGSYNQNSDFLLARYNTNGTLDTTFGTGGRVITDLGSGPEWINSIAIQSDGKIVVGGISGFGIAANFALARYTTTGALDTTFGTGGKVTTDFHSFGDEIKSVKIQSDGKIVAAGLAVNGSYLFGVARYNTNGTLDTTFDGDGKLTTDILNAGDSASDAAIQSDGKIVVFGQAADSGSPQQFALVRYNSNGTLDTSFDSDGKVTTSFGTSSAYAKRMRIQPDGRLLVAGLVGDDFTLTRYNADGSLDSTFGVNGTTKLIGTTGDPAAPYGLAIQNDGRILFAGPETAASGGATNPFRIVRLNVEGSEDYTFGTDGWVTTSFTATISPITDLAIQSDGKIVAVGYADNADRDFVLARYLVNSVPSAPSAPANLTAIGISASRVDLFWGDTAGNESGFKIERSTNGTAYTQIATVGPNFESYSDTTVAAATLYYYRVRATNAIGDSAYSNVASTRSLINAPTNLITTPVSNTQIKLDWTDNSTQESGFKIERSLDGVSFTQVATVGANVKTYTNSSLTGETIYYYRVRAYTSTVDSGYSNTATAITYSVATPTGLTATIVKSYQINLKWNNVSGNEGYHVERSTDGINFIQIATTLTNVVTYSATGLTPNTKYYFRVRATWNPQPVSNYSNVVNATTTFIPNAPSALSATPFSNYQINLAWTDNSTNESGFKIERSTDGVNFTQIATAGANVKAYSNTGLAYGTTYHYRVRAYNSTQEDSTYSNSASTTTFTNPPAAPITLAVAVASSTQLNLSWVDKSTDETGFKIERSTDGVNFTQIATVGANVKAYNNTGLSPATQYYYRVRAYHSVLGDSSYTNTANNTTYAVNPPTGLTAKVASSTSITLTWVDASTDELGFRIERGLDGINFTEIATVGAGIKTYTAAALNPNTKYYFRLRSYNALGSSPYTTIVNATTTFIPNAPSGLTAAASGNTNTTITLNWIDNATNETGFKIERSTDGVNFTQIATASANVKTYTNTGLTHGTTYYYRVRAYNATAEDSAYSNIANAATTALLPAAPSNLILTVSSSTAISLAWTDTSTNESGFKIERSTDGVNFTQIATAAANAKTYSSTGLSGGTTYWYRVRAYNTVGDSAYSNTPSATTKPATPTGWTITALAGGQMKLNWNDVFGETGYFIERSLNNSAWTQIATPTAGSTTFTDSGLTAGTRYYYRIRAANGSGYSAYSASVNAIALA